MHSSRASDNSLQRQSQWMGVVLLLLMYMAQPVLAISSALCGCSGMGAEHACSCAQADRATLDPTPSCCAKKSPVVKRACCSDSNIPANFTDCDIPEAGATLAAQSVCQCQHDPVDSTPSGVFFDGQKFEGPFAWWSVLEGHARESRCLAPHLGGLEQSERDSARVRSHGPPGWFGNSDRGPAGPSVNRLRIGGLIAFLAELSEANL